MQSLTFLLTHPDWYGGFNDYYHIEILRKFTKNPISIWVLSLAEQIYPCRPDASEAPVLHIVHFPYPCDVRRIIFKLYLWLNRPPSIGLNLVGWKCDERRIELTRMTPLITPTS